MTARTQQELRERRKRSSLPTDENGNLKIENPHRISGTKQREKTHNGRFKCHNMENEEYVQFTTPLPVGKQKDTPIE